MQTGKTTKYLKYAIGEIILVMIGILLALQVNNWNDERQRQKNINTVLKEIQADLKKDIEAASELLDGYIGKDSMYYLVINDQLTKDHYYNNKGGDQFGVYFAYWYKSYEVSDNAYLKYKGLIADHIDADDTLTSILDEMFVPLKKNISVYQQRLQNTVYENIDYLAKNKDWYYKFNASFSSLFDTDFLDFYLNDELYKNQATSYMNDFLNLVKDAQSFRIQALKASQMIAHRLSESDSLYRKQLFIEEADINEWIGEYTLQQPELSLREDEHLQVKLKNKQVYISNETEEIPLYPHTKNVFYGSKLEKVYRFKLNNDHKAPILEIIKESGHHEYHKTNN